MRATLAMILMLIALDATAANEIELSRTTVRAKESFMLTIRLEGEASEVPRIPIPLTNLEFLGQPSVMSEVRLENGRFTRTKLLRYIVQAEVEGVAVIGPIVFEAGGREIRIPERRITVMPRIEDERSEDALRRLDAEGAEAIVLDVAADRTRVVLGEQVVVTWSVLASAAVSNVNVVDLPALEGFWVEEIPVSDRDRRDRLIGGRLVTEAVIRKVALYPLQTGTLTVPPLEIRAGIVRRIDPFGFGRLREGSGSVSRSSRPLEIQVAAVPQQSDLVGSFAIECSAPQRVAGGPVTFEATISGDGNLRAAAPPQFEAPVAGEVQIEEGPVAVRRRARTRVEMERTWTWLVVPAHPGKFEMPAVSLAAWDPTVGRIEPLRCAGRSVEAVAIAPGAIPSGASVAPPAEEPREEFPIWIVAVALVLAGGIAWLLLARRKERLERVDRRILEHRDDPRRMKDETRELLRAHGFDPDALYRADTEIAESYRTLWSLLDVLEKEPWERERSEDDLARRVRALTTRLRK
ncbi:MAG: BatD family protein [Thermoanaerobaculia bacterium]